MIYDRQKKKSNIGGANGQAGINLRSEVMSAGQPNLTQRKQLLTAAQALQPAETDKMLDGSKKVSSWFKCSFVEFKSTQPKV